MNNKEGRFVVFLVFLQLLYTYPYVFEQILHLPAMRVVSIANTAILTAYVFWRTKVFDVPKTLILCCFIQIGMWLFYYILHNDTAYFTRIYFVFSSLISILALAKSKSILLFTTINNNWLCAQAVMGLVAFILVLIGVLYPLFEFENVDGRTCYFFGLTCSNAYYGSIIRSGGFFDEPGALAFWSMFALVINQLYFKNKKFETILIVGLLSTLSMMYFMQLALYFLFFKIKKIRILIPAVVFFALGFYFIQSNPDSELYIRTFQRVEDAQNGHTNRDKMLEEAMYYFHTNPLFGIGATKSEKVDPVSDNPYENLAIDGIIGTICLYLPLLIVLFRSFKTTRTRIFLKGTLVLVAGFVLRPFHVDFIHYFIVYLYLFLFLKRNIILQELAEWRSQKLNHWYQ